jgi:Helix-hairpin-helix motif
MAKANVHIASRDELVEAGLRAEIADEIIKLRRKGEISSPEALEELPGVGPATVEQLRKTFDFKAPDRGGNGGERREHDRNGSEEPARAAAEGARTVADAGTTAARSVLRVAHQTGKVAGDGQRELAERSTEGMAELNRAFLELVREQTRQSLELWNALGSAVKWDQVSKAIDWEQVAEVQSRYLRQSLERTAQLTQRYLDVGQAVMAAVSKAQGEARRAA